MFDFQDSVRSGSPPENPPWPQISSREHVELGGLSLAI